MHQQKDKLRLDNAENMECFEVEIVLLRTLWVKRNVGRGTPTDDSLVLQIKIDTGRFDRCFFCTENHCYGEKNSLRVILYLTYISCKIQSERALLSITRK